MNKIWFFALLIIAFAACRSSRVNNNAPRYNHLTIYVTDLQKSTQFYKDVMMLEMIPEPFNDNRHSWFKISEHGQLHVVSGAKEKSDHDINIHLAFSVADLNTFARHLDKHKISYGNWSQTSKDFQMRPDKVAQIYFKDPDGYWLEVNNDKY